MSAKIRVFPHGLSIGSGNFKSALIFKDQGEREILPVWLDQVALGLLLTSGQDTTQAINPFRATFKVFEGFGVSIKSVYFNEIKGVTQYAAVTAMQGAKILELNVSASDVMALAVNAGCAFFTNQNVIEKSRVLNLEWLLHWEQRPQAQEGYEGLH